MSVSFKPNYILRLAQVPLFTADGKYIIAEFVLEAPQYEDLPAGNDLDFALTPFMCGEHQFYAQEGDRIKITIINLLTINLTVGKCFYCSDTRIGYRPGYLVGTDTRDHFSTPAIHSVEYLDHTPEQREWFAEFQENYQD